MVECGINSTPAKQCSQYIWMFWLHAFLFLLIHAICSTKGKRRGGELERYGKVKGILVTHPPFLFSSSSQRALKSCCPSKTLYSKRPNSGAWSIWGWPFLQPQFDQFSRMLRGTFPEISHKSVEEFWDKCRILPWRMLPKETNNLRKHKFVQLLRRRH